jgi:general secretion pathway protein D
MTLSFHASLLTLADQLHRLGSGSTVRISGLLSVSTLVLVACATPVTNPSLVEGNSQNQLRPRPASSQPKLSGASAANEQPGTQTTPPRRETIQLGTGEMFRGAPSIGGPATGGDKSISLNFENGDIREIARNILGDLLGENFMIDPRVTGTVSIRTPKGVQRSDLLPIFETLLRQANAALVRDGLLWRVVPAAEAVQGIQRPRLGFAANDGSAVQIYTARHIGAKELQRVMLPFAKGGEAAVRVDELRNILYLAGTETEIKRLLEIASMFDIDLLAGMSFLVYTLQSADVKAVMADWERVFPAASNPFAGLLRVVPIERMNGILLVSPQSEIIVQARNWMEKLDKGSDAGGGARLYVYNLQYSYAEKLQPLLQAALTGRSNSGTTAPTVAPGQTTSVIGAPPTAVAGQPNVLPGNTVGQTPAATNTSQQRSGVGSQTPGASGSASALGLARNATVTADKDRNALLIVATPAEYAAIESVLKRLDTPPKQIAIEVQLAEVSLTGDFQFGLQTFFQGHLTGAQNRMTSADGSGSIAIPPGGTSSLFTYAWKKTDAIKAILSLSENKNQVRTLAQPTLITLDNQKASFNSGKQISVRTQTQSSTPTSGTVDSFQYINTGISLSVTPRVSGESVILEIQQEISDAAPSAGPNPDISKSTTSTTVMVQSGDTMLIGGLFNNKSSNASGGLPFASSIPVIGGLFGNQRWSSDRSEIALLITPRILGDVEETRSVVDDLRSKLVGIEALLPAASTILRPASADAKQALKALSLQAEPGPGGGALKEFAHSLKIDKAPPAPPSQ